MSAPLPPATNESWEIKRVQMEAAGCIAAFMHQLGAKFAQRRPNAWEPGVYSQFIRSDRWRKDAQVIDFHHDSHDHRKSEFVAFADVFYGPESDFIEGRPKILQNATLNVDGLTKIFDNSKGGDPLHIAYTEAVTLANSVSLGVKDAFTFDTTTESETTVSGSYAGASLEEKLTETVHVGLAKEESKDTEESKATETGVAVEFDCPAGADQAGPHQQGPQARIDPCQWLIRGGLLDRVPALPLVEPRRGRHQVPQRGPRHFQGGQREGPVRADARRRYELPAPGRILAGRERESGRGPQRDSASAGLPQPELHAGYGQDAGHREQRKLQGHRSRSGGPRCRRCSRLVRTRERGPLHAMSAKTDPAEFADAEIIKGRLDDLAAKLDATYRSP